MHELATLIIADDLTGALDSVAPFAAVGMDCVVATSPDSIACALAGNPQVLSVNLGTREGRADKAGEAARAAAQAARPHAGPETIWLKKIDSRMKGHVDAEVAGVLEAVGATQVLLCPAIPDLGRLVAEAQVTGAGVAEPIPVSLRLPAGMVADAPDARTEADLDRMVQAASPGTLFVGARGLAGALARRAQPDRAAALVPMPHGPVGFCVGSRDPVTLAQVDRLKREGDLPCLAGPDDAVPSLREAGGFLMQTVLATDPRGGTVSAELAGRMLACADGLGTLVVTGGETAAALLRIARIGVLLVAGEVLPGLPLCRAVGRPDFPVIVTKSGGFGPPDTLLRLWQAARRKEGQPCL